MKSFGIRESPENMIDLFEGGGLYPRFDVVVDARAVYDAMNPIDACEFQGSGLKFYRISVRDRLVPGMVGRIHLVDSRDVVAHGLTKGGLTGRRCTMSATFPLSSWHMGRSSIARIKQVASAKLLKASMSRYLPGSKDRSSKTRISDIKPSQHLASSSISIHIHPFSSPRGACASAWAGTMRMNGSWFRRLRGASVPTVCVSLMPARAQSLPTSMCLCVLRPSARVCIAKRLRCVSIFSAPYLISAYLRTGSRAFCCVASFPAGVVIRLFPLLSGRLPWCPKSWVCGGRCIAPGSTALEVSTGVCTRGVSVSAFFGGRGFVVVVCLGWRLVANDLSMMTVHCVVFVVALVRWVAVHVLR